MTDRLIKVERHADSLLYNTVTECNRFMGSCQETMKAARDYCRTMSSSPGHRKKRGVNVFFHILEWSPSLNEWLYVETWINGYQYD